MILALLLINTLALLLIAVLACTGRLSGPTGPAGVSGPAGPTGPTGAAASDVPAVPATRTDLAQVLKRSQSGDYQHAGWVQKDSDAYRTALARPGLAVKRHGEILDLGVQD